MTLIIAARANDGIYMLADSISVDSDFNCRHSLVEKVFYKQTDDHVEDFMLGCAGSWRAIQLLRWNVVFPGRAGVSLDKYVCSTITSSIRTTFEYNDHKPENDEDKIDVSILLAASGRIFHIDEWLQVHEYNEPFTAIGANHDGALGALECCFDEKNVMGSLTKAMEVAAKYNGAIRGPYTGYTLQSLNKPDLKLVQK